MSQLSLESFINFFEYYGEEYHQKKAIEILYNELPEKLIDESSEWIKTYRKQVEGSQAPGIATPLLMQQLTGYAAKEFDSVFINDCNRLFADTGFDKHLDAIQMLLANMMHETANFRYMQEIASGSAYNGRSDLGNTSPGDGEKYKGAGVLQLTGKFNYSRLAEGINDPRVMEGVDYVANTYPFSSARTWIEENDLLNVCLTEGFDACCRKINGGWNGYDDRLAKYAICKQYIC